MTRTVGNSLSQGKQICRLVFRTPAGRRRLAAIEIYRENDLPAFMGGIAEVGRDLGMARSAWFFRPMVYVVKLELRSLVKFNSLLSQRDILAFNNEAFDAVVQSQEYDESLTKALETPWYFGTAPDMAAWYAEMFDHNARSAAQVRRLHRALLVTYAFKHYLALWITAIIVLLAAMVLSTCIGLIGGGDGLNLGFVLAAGQVAMAYASFVANVYRIATE